MTGEPPEAHETHSRWPGWIWAVPLAAAAVVVYLGFQQLSKSGPEVTVVFPTAGGIKPSDTKVKFEGFEVGEVESIRFEKDLKHVDAVLQLHSDMSGHLGKGTRFWIAGQKPSISDLSSLKAVIAGPFIGIEPHSGDAQDRYDGLAERPVNANDAKGTHFVLRSENLGNVSRGSAVFYRDLQVGQVEDARLEPDHRHFHIDIFITAPNDALVHADTRFWDASAVHVSMADNGPKLQLQSVPSLFEGAVAFETPPGADTGPPAGKDTVFPLFDSQQAADRAPKTGAPLYRVAFDAAEARSLTPGAAVTLADKRIGSITESRLQYDPRSGQLQILATLALQPSDIALADGSKWAGDPKPQLNALLKKLIGQGLRARIGSTIPVVGGSTIELAFVPNAPAGDLGTGDVPDIPTASAGDVAGIMASVSSVASKVNAMPLDQIATDIHQATQRIAAMTSSPELDRSLANLDRSMANIEHVTQDAKAQAGPILAELRRVASEAQSTAAAARGLMSSNGMASQAPNTAGFGETLYELSRAARSLRDLTDYLDRHPEALLHGKG